MKNVQSMMNLLDMVYHTLTTRDCPTSEWRYYEGLRAMAQIAFPDFVISVGHGPDRLSRFRDLCGQRRRSLPG